MVLLVLEGAGGVRAEPDDPSGWGRSRPTIVAPPPAAVTAGAGRRGRPGAGTPLPRVPAPHSPAAPGHVWLHEGMSTTDGTPDDGIPGIVRWDLAASAAARITSLAGRTTDAATVPGQPARV